MGEPQPVAGDAAGEREVSLPSLTEACTRSLPSPRATLNVSLPEPPVAFSMFTPYLSRCLSPCQSRD